MFYPQHIRFGNLPLHIQDHIEIGDELFYLVLVDQDMELGCCRESS